MDADLIALRDALIAYSGSTEAEAEQVLGTLGAWWGMRPEQVAPVVAAVAGTLLPPPVVVLWLYWTAALARTPTGASFLLKAGWTVSPPPPRRRGGLPRSARASRHRPAPANGRGR